MVFEVSLFDQRNGWRGRLVEAVLTVGGCGYPTRDLLWVTEYSVLRTTVG